MSKMPPKKLKSSDIFQTHINDVRIVMPYLNPEWKIWENACGDGQISNFLEGEGFDIVATDIEGGFDFLSPLARTPEFDCIVTNPPYSLKDQWIERCYDLGKPWALFLPLTALEGKYRQSLYKKYGIQILLPDGRPKFKTPSGKEGGSWFYAAWFCHGLNLPEQLTFAEIIT